MKEVSCTIAAENSKINLIEKLAGISIYTDIKCNRSLLRRIWA
jgi:hypothetical protein